VVETSGDDQGGDIKMTAILCSEWFEFLFKLEEGRERPFARYFLHQSENIDG
jgi:hypothetical protein